MISLQYMDNPQNSDLIFYKSPQGNVRIEVHYAGETLWLPQKRMAELFGVEVPAVSKHLKNIFESGELQEDSVVSKMEKTAAEQKSSMKSFAWCRTRTSKVISIRRSRK
jgi:hypothetical protein